MKNSDDLQVELYYAETANLQKLHSGYEPRWKLVPSPHTRCSDLDAAISKIAILKKNEYPRFIFKVIPVLDKNELLNEYNVQSKKI